MALADGTEDTFDPTLSEAVVAYQARDAERIETRKQTFDTGRR